MYGAIFGDIIGSRFEFDRGGKTTDFELFTAQDSFTDDTVMTIAIGQALLQAGKAADVQTIRQACIRAMQDWGRRYPNAGYGGRFIGWLFSGGKPKPYGSCGNGSAMRVSAAGWLYDSLERTREAARATAEVTHNHPEGIKGAECTAAVMYLARNGADKKEIEEYIVQEFGYDVSESLEQLRARHAHVEICQDSLPKALVSFLQGSSYEEVVRNAVSLGGDTDTLAAIAGAMAEAMYGVPVGLMAKGLPYLPEDMLAVLQDFDTALGRGAGRDDAYRANDGIKAAVAGMCEEKTEEAFFKLLQELTQRVQQEGEAPAPMVDVNSAAASLDLDHLCPGDTFSLDRDLRLRFDTMVDGEGRQWIPLFTDEAELHKGQTANIIINAPLLSILESGRDSDRAEGVVINPFGQALTLPKDILRLFLEHYRKLTGQEQ